MRERRERAAPRARREAELLEQRPRRPHALGARARRARASEDVDHSPHRRLVLAAASRGGEDEPLGLVGAGGRRAHLERARDPREDAFGVAEVHAFAEEARGVDVTGAQKARDGDTIEGLGCRERLECGRHEGNAGRRRAERLVEHEALGVEGVAERHERSVVARRPRDDDALDACAAVERFAHEPGDRARLRGGVGYAEKANACRVGGRGCGRAEVAEHGRKRLRVRRSVEMARDDVGEQLERIALSSALEPLVERGKNDARMPASGRERLVESTPPHEIVRIPSEHPPRTHPTRAHDRAEGLGAGRADRRREKVTEQTAVTCTGTREHFVERMHRRRERARTNRGHPHTTYALEMRFGRATRPKRIERLVERRDRAHPGSAATRTERREQRVRCSSGEQIELPAERHLFERHGESQPCLPGVRKADAREQRGGDACAQGGARLRAPPCAREAFDVVLPRDHEELRAAGPVRGQRPNRSGSASVASKVFRS